MQVDYRFRGNIALEMKRSTSSSHKCCYPSCRANVDLGRIPRQNRFEVLRNFKFFILDVAKVCPNHLNVDAWTNVNQVATVNTFSNEQINRIIEILGEPNPRNEQNVSSDINPKLMDLCKRNTGLTKEIFIDLFNSLPSVNQYFKNRRTAASALYIYLMKMRTGLPNEDIGHVFHVTLQTVSNLISKSRQVLHQDLVPQYVNFIRNREELIEHNIQMSNSIMDSEKKGKVMLICDATYIFIDKSRNYMHQKITFSGQKKRNFIKIMNITACDGTIVFCIAPFPAVLNDASILKNLLEKTIIFDNLLEGDILLLDRGFRDVVPAIEAKGLVAKMPSLVQRAVRKGQLSTEDANRSRLVTALRFMVEVRNGHLKIIWKKFNQIWTSYAQVNIAQDAEICSALINKYRKTFESNRGCAIDVANRMLAKLDQVNEVGNVITNENFKQHIKKFTRFNAFNTIPTLTKDELFWISLGGYAIKQAESYTQMHIKQNNDQFIVFVCPQNICNSSFPSFAGPNKDLMLFMIKLKSRFRSNTTHKTFVLIDRNVVDHKSVLGHYCECYNGWRTLGCCSHIMTLVAFLLVTKGQNLANPAAFLNNLFNLFDDE